MHDNIDTRRNHPITNSATNAQKSVSWLFLDGKLKLQATFGLVAHTDGTSMQEHGILDDGEPQPCASHLPAAPLVYTIEAFEETGQMFERNTLTIIREYEMPLIAQLLGR